MRVLTVTEACYFARYRTAKYCDDRVCLSVYLCVCVCLSASISLELHARSSPNFLYVLPTVVAQSSSGGVAICHVLPVLWMTPYLHIMGRMPGYRCNSASQPDV